MIFFRYFHNHFPKIYKSVLHKIAIDLLYVWDIYDTPTYEKKIIAETWFTRQNQ